MSPLSRPRPDEDVHDCDCPAQTDHDGPGEHRIHLPVAELPQEHTPGSFVLVDDSGYPELRHYPGDDPDSDGCFVGFAESGTNLSELDAMARAHACEQEATDG